MRALAVLLIVATTTGCVHRSLVVRGLNQHEVNYTLPAPARVHLVGGSVVMMRDAFVVRMDAIVGPGMRYGPTRRDSMPVTSIPRDSVLGVEQYQSRINPVRTFVTSAGGMLGVGVIALAIALSGTSFGGGFGGGFCIAYC